MWEALEEIKQIIYSIGNSKDAALIFLTILIIGFGMILVVSLHCSEFFSDILDFILDLFDDIADLFRRLFFPFDREVFKMYDENEQEIAKLSVSIDKKQTNIDVSILAKSESAKQNVYLKIEQIMRLQYPNLYIYEKLQRKSNKKEQWSSIEIDKNRHLRLNVGKYIEAEYDNASRSFLGSHTRIKEMMVQIENIIKNKEEIATAETNIYKNIYKDFLDAMLRLPIREDPIYTSPRKDLEILDELLSKTLNNVKGITSHEDIRRIFTVALPNLIEILRDISIKEMYSPKQTEDLSIAISYMCERMLNAPLDSIDIKIASLNNYLTNEKP